MGSRSLLTMIVRRTNTAQLAKQTFPWLVIMDRPEGWPPLPAPCPACSPPPPAPPVMELPVLLAELPVLLTELPVLLAELPVLSSAELPVMSLAELPVLLLTELSVLLAPAPPPAALLPFLLAAAWATLQALS